VLYLSIVEVCIALCLYIVVVFCFFTFMYCGRVCIVLCLCIMLGFSLCYVYV